MQPLLRPLARCGWRSAAARPGEMLAEHGLVAPVRPASSMITMAGPDPTGPAERRGHAPIPEGVPGLESGRGGVPNWRSRGRSAKARPRAGRHRHAAGRAWTEALLAACSEPSSSGACGAPTSAPSWPPAVLRKPKAGRVGAGPHLAVGGDPILGRLPAVRAPADAFGPSSAASARQ
jgi:hypothetical protein